MDTTSILIGLLIGAVLGAIGFWLATRERFARLTAEIATAMGRSEELLRRNEEVNGQLQSTRESLARFEEKASQAEVIRAERDGLRAEVDELGAKIAEFRERQVELETERKNLETAKEEQKQLLEAAETQLREAFQALSGEALRKNNQTFLELAEEKLKKTQEEQKGDLEKRHQSIEAVVKPLNEKLGAMEKELQEIEKTRAGAYGEIQTMVKQMAEGTRQLQSETRNLVSALKTPVRRGQWGEIQLRRVAEMAGMVAYCDFAEQVSTTTEEGRLRPDMIVKLPSDKRIVVDSKAALDAYMRAVEETDEEKRKTLFETHAAQVRKHVVQLSGKEYQKLAGDPAPDFVVLFLPGEPIFSAALEHDPMLIEFAADRNVIIATPTTLIALLRAVAYGWRQVSLEEDARKIAELGKELYNRFIVMAEHITRTGRSLDSAVNSYNEMVGSIESRVLPQARKMKELPALNLPKDIEELKPVEKRTRQIQSPDMPALPFDLDPV